MKVCLIQNQSRQNLATNVQDMHALLQAACTEEKPDWLLLPEVWDWVGGSAQDKRRIAQPEGSSAALDMVREVARQHGVWIHAGSVFEREDHAVFNTTFVFNRQGERVARYRKLHLFDVTTPDGKSYHESQVFRRGQEVVTYDCEGVRIGCAICYDLRFAELFVALRRAGAQVIALPALFTLQTGKDHWETLCRARAIETQTWFCAAGQCGAIQQRTADGVETRAHYGHSLVADPWGVVRARLSDRPGWVTTRLDMRLLQDTRNLMPVMAHRRDDLFAS